MEEGLVSFILQQTISGGALYFTKSIFGSRIEYKFGINREEYKALRREYRERMEDYENERSDEYPNFNSLVKRYKEFKNNSYRV